MATKDAMLKKQLIKEGTIVLVLLAVLGIGGYFLSGYDDDSLAEKQAQEGESANLRSQHESIKQELGTGFEVSAYYETYTRNHNPDFLLNREAASQMLNVLREKNHLASLSVTISPISDTGMETIHLKSGILTKSDVHLMFEAISDNSLYGFIESLERSLPGIVAIKEIKFSRSGELSSAAIMAMSQHHITPLVTGELSFIWLGIRPADVNAKPGSPSAPPGGMR